MGSFFDDIKGVDGESGFFDMEGIKGTGRNALDPGAMGSQKLPVDPRVIPGFEGLAAQLMPMLQGIQQSGSQFQSGGKFSAENAFSSPLFTGQLALAGDQANQIGESDIFGQSLSALGGVVGGDGFSGVTEGLMSSFANAIKPGQDILKDFMTADVFEGAARSGTVRSSQTGEANMRGLAQIDAAGQQAGASFAGQVAPSFIGAQMGAIGQGLGLPMQGIQGLAGPLAQLMQQGQFQQGMLGDAFDSIFTNIPIQEGRLGGKAGGQGASNMGMIAGMCWVAREVYGHDNPKWLDMRDYLLHQAPREFVMFYAKHGPTIAASIVDNDEAKARIRTQMDTIIERAA